MLCCSDLSFIEDSILFSSSLLLLTEADIVSEMIFSTSEFSRIDRPATVVHSA
jgi:hypothetical protein